MAAPDWRPTTQGLHMGSEVPFGHAGGVVISIYYYIFCKAVQTYGSVSVNI